MKKKLCCILMLIIFLLNSSIMLVISEAVDAVKTSINDSEDEEKIKALAEINLTKYENFDTTTENSDSGSKGVLVQLNLKTGIEFAEGEEYRPIQKTTTNINLPWICNNKPSRVEVITKSTQATNGGKEANYEYHSSTGILSITAENSEYTENVADARDEYEIICIYKSECYTNDQENNFKVQLNTYEALNDEEETKISTKVEENYTCTDNVGGIISTEHQTDDIYDGYITANTLNSENNYETTYNEKLKIMVSNKDVAQKIEVRETSETSLYTETSIDKEQALEILGDNGSIDLLDESGNVLKTINKDTETDENGKIKVTYENRAQNLIVRLNNLEKEGIIEVENSRIIESTAEIIDNVIPTYISIKGINTISTEVENEDGEKVIESSDVVKYERQGQSKVQIKQAVSNIDAKLNNDRLVNNTQNDLLLTVTLRTDDPRYSLFKNPTISIEMPAEVKELNMGTPEIMYDNQIFSITSSGITTNSNGNKVINLQLQGCQTSYEHSSVVEGTNIIIPLTINLTKQLENKVSAMKFTYSNEMTSTIESKEMEVTLLNKIAKVVPEIYATTANTEATATYGQNGSTAVYEQDGVKVEIIEEVGNSTIANNGTIYEEQIIKHNVKVTNNNTTSKKVALIINVPDEMTYVKLQTGGYIYNEEKNYYKYSSQYEYEEQEDKQVKIELDIKAGETKTDFIELKVNDLQDDIQEKQISINYELQIDEKSPTQFSIQNIEKQAEVEVRLECMVGYERRDWQYGLTVTNLTNRELKNVTIVFEASDMFNIDNIAVVGDNRYENLSGNVWTYTIEKLEPRENSEEISEDSEGVGNGEKGIVYCLIEGEMGDIDESKGCEYEINGLATVYGDDISTTYSSNQSRMTGYIESVEVDITADKAKLKMDDEITYTVNLQNTGKTWGGFAIYTNVNVKDVIPRELEPISITYNNFIINKETVKEPTIDGEDEIGYESQTYTEETVTKDISTLDIPEGYDEEDAPNINLDLAIPEGKTVTMTIKAKARMLTESTEITNTITATGDYIKTKTATVTSTILQYDYVDPEENPDNPVDPVNPDNPVNPSDPTDPSNPNNSTTQKISISGVAWIDENEDGKRTTDEKTYSNMTVMLYDYKNNTFIKENNQIKKVQTNSNGEYEFTNLDKSQYIVVFLYDTNKYTLTEYQKDGVMDSKNCDAVTKTIGINGETLTAGLTNTLTANSDLQNIDIGLVENKSFDLEIQKYINKITVQTNDNKTKTYTYDNKQLAKVEIHSKKINGATVIIEYKMVVTNRGEVVGKAAQIVDKLPEGLKFKSELNSDWYESNGALYTNSLSGQTIDVGESKEVSLLLTKEVNSNNVGIVTNIASIGISNNDKAIEDGNVNNDSSNAQVIIGVSTGLVKWLGITIGIIVVLAVMAILIWKNKKALKIITFVFVLSICLIGNVQQVFGYTAPGSIRGVNMVAGQSFDTEYAIGKNNNLRYHCGDKGLPFCNRYWHTASYSFTQTISTTNSSWSSVEDLKLTNKTNNNNVTFTKIDDNYNKVGPFKVSSNKSSATQTVKVTYKDKSGTTKTESFSLINFAWDQDFYIKVPKSVMEIIKIEVSGEYTAEQKRTVTSSVRYWYTCYISTSSDTWCKNQGGEPLQRMYTIDIFPEEKTEKQNVTKKASVDINGPWSTYGDLEIQKVDAENAQITLKNTEFKLLKGTDKNASMIIYDKDGEKIDRLIVESGIEFKQSGATLGSTPSNTTNAIVNGEEGYTIEFNSPIDDATTLVTNEEGKALIKNLLCGEYTFVETGNLNYGYTKMVTVTIKGFGALTQTTWTIKNEKQIGEIYIKKIDDRVPDKELPGVEFVLKSSYQNKYIKVKATGDNVINDDNGWTVKAIGTSRINDLDDITDTSVIQYTSNIEEATRFVTDTKAELRIQNLLISTNGSDKIKYHLEEVANPNYGYLADTNQYLNHMLTFVGESTTSDGWITPIRIQSVATTVKNHQEYIRLEGYVWEEIAVSKSNFINNLYNETDALVEGINVYLCKEGNVVSTTTTDSNGWYCFGTIREEGDSYTNEDYLTTENGNLLIDDLDKYYVEFEYDGLKFTSVEAIVEYLNSDYAITSKATETPSGRADRKDRESVNADFSEITNGASRNNSNEVYELEYEYNTETHIATYIDHWLYEYNEDKTRLKVTPSDKEDYAIIASTQISEFSLKDAWETRCKDTGEEVLTGINLGIQRRSQPDLAISTDISSLNIIVQNYENTYTYENRKDYQDQNENDPMYEAAKDGFGAEVKFGNKNIASIYSNRGLKIYTRRIYESDLALYDQNFDSNQDLMQIYVTYKIAIKNQSERLTSTVNELVNYYDSRYTIAESWIINDNEKTDIGKEAWSPTSKYGNSYKTEEFTAAYTQAMSDMTISPNAKIEVYIKFRLQPEAVKALIEKQTTLNNVSEITSFSTMSQTDNGWVPYAGIDKDSNPGSVESIELGENVTGTVTLNNRDYLIETKTLDETYYEDDTDSAPSLILGIEEGDPTRGLSGTVFEDEDALHENDDTHLGEERIGDGILYTGEGEYRGSGLKERIDENRVAGVKVELLEDNGNVATLHKISVDDSGTASITTEKAETWTDDKGEYTFTGVIPGRYLIRYTYSNEKSYITDSSGNKIEQMNVRDYKSTVITSDLMKVALNLNEKIDSSKDERMGDLNWILKYDNIPNNGNYTDDSRSKSKDLDALIKYSDAADDTTKRDEIDDLYYETYDGMSGSNYEMTADTAYFDVGVEYSEVNEVTDGFADRISYTDYKDEYELEDGKILVLENGRLKIIDTFYAVNPYQDFGITERARQDYEINKRVSSLKLTLANGQILINGNPYKQLPEVPTENFDEYWNELEAASDNPLPYVKALPGQVTAEIDNEILQAATLNVEYTITIRDKSELDYQYTEDQDYYYYGINGQNEMSTVIRKVVDYMDDDLEYDEKTNGLLGWKKVTPEELHKWEYDTDNNNSITKQLISDDVYNAIKQGGYTTAVTEQFYKNGQGIGVGKVASMKICGSKVLTTSENGTTVKNHVEIIETMGIRSIKSSIPGNYNPTTEGPNEPDDDMTSVIITPPTGLLENKIFIVSGIAIILSILAGGIYLIKKKVLE